MAEKSTPLFLDTQLVSFAADNKNSGLSKAVNDHFKNLDKKYELSISGITRYELFQHSSPETAKRVKGYTDFLRTFEVSSDVLNVAAVLSTCYKQHPVIKCRCDSISMADKIIGATVLIEKDSLILTSDFNDFPRPFFEEYDIASLTYQNGRRSIEVYMLKPSPRAYARQFRLCYPKAK